MANFGDISTSLVLGSLESAKRKDDDSGFEAFETAALGDISLVVSLFPVNYFDGSPIELDADDSAEVYTAWDSVGEDGETVIWTLPAAAAGLFFTFYAFHVGGSDGLIITPNGTDKIWHNGTLGGEGKYIATGTAGRMISLAGTDDGIWREVIFFGAWTFEI